MGACGHEVKQYRNSSLTGWRHCAGSMIVAQEPNTTVISMRKAVNRKHSRILRKDQIRRLIAIMYETGQNPHASTSYPRQEEARPFPQMAPSPPPSARPNSTSPSLSRDDSGERDASANFGDRYSTEQSPAGASGVHPGEGGIFNFSPSEGGGPVRLTNLTPISPTNEDVYSSEQLQRNPQPPISVLSPSRPGSGYPFLFTGHGPPLFSMQENEKYRKLMLKKQKRGSKKEKNVLNVFKAEDIEGHKGEEDLDSVLQSMGEKSERSRRSVEKELEGEEEEDKSEDNEKLVDDEIKVVDKVRNKFVEDDLMAFKDNFYLVTPEPGPLTRHKSRDCLVGSLESLPGMNSSPSMSFTKVTSKKHRTKRSKEETGKPPPGPAVSDSRRAAYALRSRDPHSGGVAREQTASPTEQIISRGEQNPPLSKKTLEVQSLESQNFPKLVKDDFPALPGLGVVSGALVLPSAWNRAVAKNSDNEEVTDDGNVLDNKVEIENHKDSNACEASDLKAVINCDVPSDSVCIDIEDSIDNIEDVEEDRKDEDEDYVDEVTVTKTDIYADLTNFPNDAEVKIDDEEDVVSTKVNIDNIEVVTSEDEFNRRKADNSAPVVIFSENDQDWTSAEFTFGFDVNEDLVANCASLPMETSHPPQHMWSMPGPLTSIDTMDGAILSFGGPDSLRMIVPVAVGVPVPVSGMGEHLPPLPFYPHQFPNGVIPPFRAYGMSFGHQMAPQGVIHHPYHEEELELVEKGVGDNAREDHTISPETGISSASPLSWQPDSSPSLPAPGSYPLPREAGRDNPAPLPLVSQVSQSLSNWQGHSVHSDSSESDRSSPAPGWATQVEIEEDKVADAATKERSDKTNDSGMASENSNSLLEKDLKDSKLEKFNLGEIVSFISSSWSSVSQDSSVSVFSAASHVHKQVSA